MTLRFTVQRNGGTINKANEESELIWRDDELSCRHVKS